MGMLQWSGHAASAYGMSIFIFFIYLYIFFYILWHYTTLQCVYRISHFLIYVTEQTFHSVDSLIGNTM